MAGNVLLYTALATLICLPLIGVLAVESRMSGRESVGSAHAAGKPVYVWTVNDAQHMISLMGLGVDGLITNRPALVTEVVVDDATVNSAERLFLFVMTRLGVREEFSEPEGDSRP